MVFQLVGIVEYVEYGSAEEYNAPHSMRLLLAVSGHL